MLTYPEIDPVILSIFGLKIRWYGMMYVLGFLAGWWLARRRSRQPWSVITPEQVDDLVARRREAARRAAERLAQRGSEHVDLVHHPVVLGRAPAGGAQEAGGVAVVDHHQRIVLLGQGRDLVQFRDVAVHAEGAVGGDQPGTAIPRGLQGLFQRLHVAVRVAVALGLAQADAVDDRGVVEGVRDDGVLRAEQGLEQAAVGIETRGVEDRVVGAEKVRNGSLELLVQVLRAADEPHAGETEAMIVQRLVGGGDDVRVVGEAEVVVGAKVDELTTRTSRDGRRRAVGGGLLRLPDAGVAARRRRHRPGAGGPLRRVRRPHQLECRRSRWTAG